MILSFLSCHNISFLCSSHYQGLQEMKSRQRPQWICLIVLFVFGAISLFHILCMSWMDSLHDVLCKAGKLNLSSRVSGLSWLSKKQKNKKNLVKTLLELCDACPPALSTDGCEILTVTQNMEIFSTNQRYCSDWKSIFCFLPKIKRTSDDV